MSGRELTVDPTGTHVIRDGKFLPLIIDTAWSVFADAEPNDWRFYLRTRRQQGFTSVAVSILPILHDRAIRDTSRVPFALDDEGHYRFDEPNAEYFHAAKELALIAEEEGFVLSLVLLWVNYIGDTWGAKLTPWAVMSREQRHAYVSLVVETFAEFDPIIVVSGDEHFVDDGPIADYVDMLDQLAAEAPQLLTALHSAPMADLPPVLADSDALDLYVYQSGHDVLTQFYCADLATLYRGKAVRRPIVNLEPVYENLARINGIGRWDAADVRRASWTSILAGASAGIGYGAHGIWQWQVEGAVLTTMESAYEPLPWQVALALPGANDVSLMGELIRAFSLHLLEAHQDLVIGDVKDTRVAMTPTHVVIYLPTSRDVTLAIGDPGVGGTAWSLADRRPLTPRLTRTSGGVRLDKFDVPGDVIVFLERTTP